MAPTQQSVLAVPSATLSRLVRSLAPDRIVLFGSRARGNARPESDVDLLLIGRWNVELASLLCQARLLVAHSFPAIDLMLCTPADIAAAKSGRLPFLLSVLESGITVYERFEGSGRFAMGPPWPLWPPAGAAQSPFYAEDLGRATDVEPATSSPDRWADHGRFDARP